MAGGQRINDHGFWAGKGGKSSVLAEGVHFKAESSAEGAGHEADYEDTTEKVKAQQMAGVGKIKGRPMAPLYRN